MGAAHLYWAVIWTRLSTCWGTFEAGWKGSCLARLLFPRDDGESSGCSAPRKTDMTLPLLSNQLEEYFSGLRWKFTVPLHLEGTEFQLRTWRALAQVPYGQTITYGELARRIGPPGAARAVGGAMATNPVPILLPCHRVVGSGGTLGGFGPGIAWKRRLLALETKNQRGQSP